MPTVIEPCGVNLHITSSAGDDFVVTSSSLKVKDVKLAIAGVLPGLEINRISNASTTLIDEDFILDRDSPVEISYLLNGGGFEVVKSYPDLANCHLLCFKCGCKDFPNWKIDWLCEGNMCCCFNKFGVSWTELKKCQVCCVGPCEITSPKLNTTTGFPDMCVCQFLLWKCGMEKCPDFMKEDFVSEKCLCLHEECGFSDMVKDCQLCCFKLTC